MLLPDAIFELKIHQNAFVAGALPRTQQEELTVYNTTQDPLASGG